MEQKDIKRQSIYPTIALGLTIVILLMLMLSAFFFTGGNNLITQAIQKVETTNNNIDLSLLTSLMKQGKDNISSSSFMLWISAAFIILVLVFQILIRRNYLVLVDEFFSIVEKYRQLLSTKKVLEAELNNARKKITDLRSMLEISKKKITDLEIRLDDSQIRIQNLEASLEHAQTRIQNLEKNK